MSQDIVDRARRVKLLIIDIDGVMTDGHIIYSIYGDELKFFDVQDGFGITLLNRAGIKSVIITAKKSRIVKLRARDMKVAKAYQGHHDKLKPFTRALRKFRVSPEEVCFIGDDLIDIPILKRVGFAVAVPNAVDEVKRCAHHITERAGGHGAVRELCDLILKSQGKWEIATEKYFK
ncbi:MAG: HAD-IIIA family hydrolase [Candidatus Omnitrophica bacterium]|nr:HAD-IIIA family hydrolase [Candidatus Omnitrophota bacterium]MCM8790925.1 HAD-IIIA family hydrolase [Candidatus Omnitrophota bacterium]